MSDTLLTLKVTGLGHKLTLNVTETATIGDLKREIETRTSLPANYQRLISRGKKLDTDDATLASLDIKNRTSIMLLHNESYAADKQAIDEIMALSKEIDDLAANKDSLSREVLHERVTAICCKVDEVDTHGSESLRAMRKAALKKAEAVDPPTKK